MSRSAFPVNGGSNDGVVSGATLNQTTLNLLRTESLPNVTVDLVSLSGSSGTIDFPNTYLFVSTSGTSSGVKGDITQPFAFSAITTNATAGDTVVFLPGSYTINENIYVNGVNYRTFGGFVDIDTNTNLFQIVGNLSANDLFVLGEFRITLDDGGAGTADLFDMENLQLGSSGSIVINIAQVTVVSGNAAFYLPRTSNYLSISSRFCDIQDGRLTVNNGNNVSTTLGSDINFPTVNSSTSSSVLVYTSSGNAPVNINANITTTVGAALGVSIVGTFTGNIRAAGSAGNSTMVADKVTATIVDGTKYIIGNGHYDIRGEDTEFEISSGANAFVDGSYLNCTMDGQQGQIIYNGYYEDCTITAVNGNQQWIFNGTAKNLTIGNGDYFLDGYIILADDETISPRYVAASCIIIGNVNDGLIQIGGSVESFHEIYGQIINQNTGANAFIIETTHTAAVTKNISFNSSTVLQAGTGATASIVVGNAGSPIVEFKSYGIFVSNKGITDTGDNATFTIGSSSDLRIDEDLDLPIIVI